MGFYATAAKIGNSVGAGTAAIWAM